jgi:predicted metal-dependent hydrolase
MSSLTRTPADLEIHPRDLSFRDRELVARHWLGGSPVASAFFNALSASFPMGERFFIDAVRRFRDRAPPHLANQITAFIAQESVHTREHLLFNVDVGSQGYDFAPINAYLAAQFRWARTRPPLQQLAATTALEHFTAILAHVALADRSHLADAPEHIQRLWRWHAIEEIEHKAVAFDTFHAATRNMTGFTRWLLRCYTMLVSTVLFFAELFFSVSVFFRQDGINTPRTWLRFLHYIFVRPGMLRKILPSYLHYFKPRFHPWQVDDRALIAAVERELASVHVAA